MSRFIFLTDTHISAGTNGFYQQPRYPDKLEYLVDELKQVIAAHEIDFVLHGGDMIDTCTPETIREAKRLFQLPVPVYLSLGNHDLDSEDALALWLEHAPEFFPGGSPLYTIEQDDLAIHVIPNQWEADKPYCWKQAQIPFFLDEQLHQLTETVQQYSDKTQLISVHNPVFGVSKEQSGRDHIIHDVPVHFRDTILGLMKDHPSIKGVLSGHNHINTLVQTDEGIFLSGSAFVETPFEYKIIEADRHLIRIETVSVNAPANFMPEYNKDRAFVQGRASDRSCEWRFQP